MEAPKRYFWLRLHDDFFDSLRIKKLRRMAGGDTFTIIYLKMQLKSIKTNGILTYTGVEEDFASEIALDIDEDVENVKITLAYLQSCGLVETEDSVNFLLPYAVSNTGSETASTQRSRECRERQKMLQCNTNATQLQQKCNGEIEIEKEKDIEIYKERVEREKPRTLTLGSHKNVILDEDKYAKLDIDFPWLVNHYVERLSDYLYQHPGKTYIDHAEVIRKWIAEDKEKQQEKPKPKKKGGNYSNFDPDEALASALKRGYDK